MNTAVRIATGVIVAIGVAEMAMTSIAALAGLSSWTARFVDLTHIAPSTALRLTFGVAAAVAAVGLAIGYSHPQWWMVGGVLLALLAGAILGRQIAIGTTGTELIAYSLFTFCGVVSAVTGAITS